MRLADNSGRGLGYWPVVSIGIGGMVGGGIFAVLGLAVQLAGGATPIAFFVAGMVAAITSYSYAKLSVKYPSQGGTVEFLIQGFGTDLFTGGLNVLLWISYLVMLALYASAFGSYGASFFPASIQGLMKHVLMSAVILGFTALNLLGAVIVGRAEEAVVAFKLTILLVFVGVGMFSITSSRLAPSTWPSGVTLVAGGMIIFVAYEGFELIANTAKDVKDPAKTLPLAYYTAVGFVIALYVLVALVTVGNLPVKQIIGAKGYALAQAAKPFLGQAGFAIIAVAAMLSTASAINATLYGTARVSYSIAKDGELPRELERRVWRRPIEGLLITAALTLVIANLFDLSRIATMGSAGFLLIFAAVNASNYRLRGKTASHGWISLLGVVACLGALGALLWETAAKHPLNILVLVVMAGLSFVIEAIYRKATGRQIMRSFTDDKPAETVNR
jgi:amino acid transporter